MTKKCFYHGTTQKLQPGQDLLCPNYDSNYGSSYLFTTTDFSAALGYALARNNDRYTFMWEPKTQTLIVDPDVAWDVDKCAYVYTVSPNSLKKYIPDTPSFFTPCSNYYTSNEPVEILTIKAIVTPDYLKSNNISLYVAKQPHLADSLYNLFERQLMKIAKAYPDVSVNPEDEYNILDIYKKQHPEGFLDVINGPDFIKIV
ncbi:MAG: hypothetical protein MJ158_03345 [Alphaproteobacteria bacterium]|nr:hypothetical protein [Alphaproteobacteria bacterium]